MTRTGARPPAGDPSEAAFARRRHELIAILAADGIEDRAVLAAIERVPRHRFVPPATHDEAYGNYPLPIGHGQTISQPYIVAYMTEAARLAQGDNVLEVGTGCGYQTAVLAEALGLGPASVARADRGALASIEIVPELAERARATLTKLGYPGVALRTGDAYLGWPERAPFDAIVVTAAPGHVPAPLLDQLAEGGRLVIPVGTDTQFLRVITRVPDGFVERDLLPVRFVPMTGEAERRDSEAPDKSS